MYKERGRRELQNENGLRKGAEYMKGMRKGQKVGKKYKRKEENKEGARRGDWKETRME